MSFYTMADNNVPITANRDGALYNVALSNQSFIIKGMGNEYEPSVVGLQFSVGTGIAVIHGRHVTSQLVTSDNTLELPPNTNGYVVLRLDLSRPIGNEAYLFATPTLTQQEINWNGTIYDLPIATYISTTTNANIVDVRNVKENAIDIEVIKSQVMQAIYPVNTIYATYTETNPSTILGFGLWEQVGSTIITSVTENIFGNGKTFPLTDNGSIFGVTRMGGGGGNYGIGSNTGVFGAWNGTYAGGNFGTSAPGYSMGVPTKSQVSWDYTNTGLMVERSVVTCYLWRRIA